MASIIIKTQVNNAVEIVFDLSRSIDLHTITTAHTGEKAVAGRMQGLIEQGEEVIWRAKHLFKLREFTSRITAMERPVYFKDEMQKGDFKKFSHEHFFEKNEAGTLMTDKILLESPYGIIGKMADAVFLKNYIRRLLLQRNDIIKQYAESDSWKKILNNP